MQFPKHYQPGDLLLDLVGGDLLDLLAVIVEAPRRHDLLAVADVLLRKIFRIFGVADGRSVSGCVIEHGHGVIRDASVRNFAFG